MQIRHVPFQGEILFLLGDRLDFRRSLGPETAAGNRAYGTPNMNRSEIDRFQFKFYPDYRAFS